MYCSRCSSVLTKLHLHFGGEGIQAKLHFPALRAGVGCVLCAGEWNGGRMLNLTLEYFPLIFLFLYAEGIQRDKRIEDKIPTSGKSPGTLRQ